MLLYNNQLVDEEELKLPLSNRAFQYNDGFFETIMVRNGQLRFWYTHLQRMQEAAATLRIVLPAYFLTPAFEDKLLQLAQEEKALQRGRLKLQVWRAGAGLYTPQKNETDWLATVQATNAVPETSLHVGVSGRVHTSYSPLSHFKGPNAPLYVLAAIEKQEQSLDDLILLSPQHHVAELTASNLFWISEGILYTPALDTGCVNGVLRRNILQWCKSKGIKIREAYFALEQLQSADAVFSANVTGMRSIATIEGVGLSTKHRLLKDLKADLLG